MEHIGENRIKPEKNNGEIMEKITGKMGKISIKIMAKIMGKTEKINGKIMGKQWGNHGETMGENNAEIEKKT